MIFYLEVEYQQRLSIQNTLREGIDNFSIILGFKDYRLFDIKNRTHTLTEYKVNRSKFKCQQFIAQLPSKWNLGFSEYFLCRITGSHSFHPGCTLAVTTGVPGTYARI